MNQAMGEEHMAISDADNLIFGQGKIQRIVGMEDNTNGSTELFIQQLDGTITTQTVENDYWILTSEPADKVSEKLEGNNYFKYRNSFSDRSDFEYARNAMYRHKDKAYWISEAREAFMLQSGETYYKGLKQKDVSVLSFDIETTGLKLDKTSKVLLISNTYRDSFGNIERKLFSYDEHANDKEFFESWCAWVRKVDPSVIIGHHIFGFDFAYVAHCAAACGARLALGRKEKIIRFNRVDSKFRKDGSSFIEYKKCYIYGREIIDTNFLSIRYDVAKNFISYGLKSLISQLGLERKNRQFYEASNIRKNYQIPEEWIKIKAYAMHDADDALALYDLMSPSIFYTAQHIPKTYQEIGTSASGSQINSILVRAYLQQGHSIPQATEVSNFSGGISFGLPGIYRNCWKLDIKSCYPSAILINELYSKHKDPKKCMYELCKYFTEQRFTYKAKYKETKDEYYASLDAAAKIFINSMFGFCGAPGLNFNDPEIAAKITSFGRTYLNQGMVWATGYDSNHWEDKVNETT
jgi:DNA polymerase I